MNKYLQCILFILFTIESFDNCINAQSLPVGTPVLEDTYRKEQLLGHVDSNVSFTIRPLFPASVSKIADVFFPNLSQDRVTRTDSGRYGGTNRKMIFKIMPVIWENQYNTHNPYGWNDGSMIPAAGYQSLLTAGFYLKYSFLSVQLSPEFVYAENKNFDGFTQAGNDSKAWGAWYSLYNTTDLPERFGRTSYTKLLAGQSSIRVTFDPISLGLSTENLWWGPGIRNSIVMSNTATGFAHLTLNTTRPVNTPVGTFEAQLIAGKLVGSGYSPLVAGQSGNRDDLYKPKPEDWRYLSGLAFTYHPKWVPGLFLGFTRVFQIYHTDMGHSFSDYFPVITPFLKSSFYNPNTGINTEDKATRDQLASIFLRWLWTGANAEIYFEYGRNDHNWDTRDLLLDPEHSRAYILGFRKLFMTGNKLEHFQVSVEATQLGQPADDIVNRPAGSYYQHNTIVQGYTNNGEVLGAGIGPGGVLQTLDVSWFKGLTKIGLQLERYEHSTDFYYQAFAAGEVRRHWVDYTSALNVNWSYRRLIFSAELLYVRELNYQWKLKDDPNLFYFNQQRDDANNFRLNLTLVRRF